ncbi:MAG: hypothetical protein J6M53_02205 [Bacteroidaceae bacterium]|nr:hypothetical protein [Bacteroidaceae bacterium]
MQTNKDLHSFDLVMDALYGTPGSLEREQFRREAYSYCVGQIGHDARNPRPVA